MSLLLITLTGQIALGAMNVILLAPVWLQMTHLLVAEIFWILLVLASPISCLPSTIRMFHLLERRVPRELESCPQDNGRHQQPRRSLFMRRRLQIVGESRSRAHSFARIEDAIAAIRAGQMVIVVDDEDRENEGDLTIAAERSHRKPLTSWRSMAAD